jgi:hypothetical protein
MLIHRGFPKKFINGEAIAEKRGAQRVTRVERIVHDWLYEWSGKYPLIHYFDANGKFFRFRSYLEFEKKVGRADDHTVAEDEEAKARARRAKLKAAWARPETRRRHAAAYETKGRKKFKRTMKKLKEKRS